MKVAPVKIVGTITPGMLIQPSPTGSAAGAITNPHITTQKISFMIVLRFCNI